MRCGGGNVVELVPGAVFVIFALNQHQGFGDVGAQTANVEVTKVFGKPYAEPLPESAVDLCTVVLGEALKRASKFNRCLGGQDGSERHQFHHDVRCRAVPHLPTHHGNWRRTMQWTHHPNARPTPTAPDLAWPTALAVPITRRGGCNRVATRVG